MKDFQWSNVSFLFIVMCSMSIGSFLSAFFSLPVPENEKAWLIITALFAIAAAICFK